MSDYEKVRKEFLAQWLRAGNRGSGAVFDKIYLLGVEAANKQWRAISGY